MPLTSPPIRPIMILQPSLYPEISKFSKLITEYFLT